MSNILKSVWEKYIFPYFMFGRRWIFLVGIWALVALHQAIGELIDLGTLATLFSQYFIFGAIVIIAVCFVVHAFVTRRPPKNRFRIAVAGFYAVTENAKDEAGSTRHRLIENLKERTLSDEVQVEILSVKEIVDWGSRDGRSIAEKLAKEYRAHMTLGGTVRLDQEYYFSPFMVTRFRHPFEISLAEGRPEKEIAADNVKCLQLKETKTNQEADLVAFVTGIAKIKAERYQEAAQIFASIPDGAAPVWFYRGFALIKLEQTEKAFYCFNKAGELNNDYADAWLYAAYALRKLGGYDQLADKYFEVARTRKVSLLQSDETIRNDLICRAFETLEEVLEECKTLLDAKKRNEQKFLAISFLGEGLLPLQTGKYIEAIPLLDQALKICPEFNKVQPYRGFALAKVGREEEAKAALQRVQEGTQEEIDFLIVARAYALLRDKALMLDSLAKAIKHNPKLKSFAHSYDEFKDYRSDPEFKKLLE